MRKENRDKDDEHRSAIRASNQKKLETQKEKLKIETQDKLRES